MHQLEKEEPQLLEELASLTKIYNFVVNSSIITKAKLDDGKNMKPVFNNLPADTSWKHIKIEFQNRDDIKIYINDDFFKCSNVKEMRFIRSRTKDEKNDNQWELLRHLAIIYYAKNDDGELLIIPTIENLARELKVTSDVIMKRKGQLETQLENAFGIKKPFKNYDASRGYETKFVLVPEADLRSDKIWKKAGADFNDAVYYDDSQDLEQ